MQVGDTIGKYRIHELLAWGGMGEIWLAQHEGPGNFQKRVVLKTIRSEYFDTSSKIERMFINEARLAARLEHPHIVHTFDFGNVDGVYFLVMEYVNGRTLRQTVRQSLLRGELIPPWMALRIIVSICEAMQYAHDLRDGAGRSLDLVHRDITPENIMISFEGAVKLLDFGLAKTTNRSHLSTTGTLKGKYAYIPPELILGAHADRRCDIYSIGVILYELFTGVFPFNGDNHYQLLNNILKSQPLAPSCFAGWMPPRLEAIIVRCMQRQMQDRYSEARELTEELWGLLRKAKGRHELHDIASFMRELFLSERATPSQDALAGRQQGDAPAAGAPETSAAKTAPAADAPETNAAKTAPAADAPETNAAEAAPLGSPPPPPPARCDALANPQTSRETLLPPVDQPQSPVEETEVSADPDDFNGAPEQNGGNELRGDAGAPPQSPAVTLWDVAAKHKSSPGSLATKSDGNGDGNGGQWASTSKAAPQAQHSQTAAPKSSAPGSDGDPAEDQNSIASLFDLPSRVTPRGDIFSSPGFYTKARHSVVKDTPAPSPPAVAPPEKGSPGATQESEALFSLPFFKKQAESQPAPARSTDTEAPVADEPPQQKAAQHFENGLSIMRQGDYRLALEQWKLASSLDPENQTYRSNIKRLRDLIKTEEKL